jgi:membrane protein DedA with SNARE-associated domain
MRRENMMLESIITTYGYPALFAGTFLEGETTLIIAGFLAHRGYLELPWIVFVAFLGTLAGDQFFFQLGRRSGEAFLKRKPQWQLRTEKARKLFENHQILIVLGFRFLYGIRTVTPFVIGMSGFDMKLFIFLNIISAFIWAIVIGYVGYAFGQFLEIVLGDIKKFEAWIMLGVLIVGGLIWFYHLRKRRHKY